MQNKEMEEIRHNAANLTALQAIGPRKKQKLDTDVATTTVSSINFVFSDNLCSYTFFYYAVNKYWFGHNN